MMKFLDNLFPSFILLGVAAFSLMVCWFFAPPYQRISIEQQVIEEMNDQKMMELVLNKRAKEVYDVLIKYKVPAEAIKIENGCVVMVKPKPTITNPNPSFHFCDSPKLIVKFIKEYNE